jgi:hypothetical protein
MKTRFGKTVRRMACGHPSNLRREDMKSICALFILVTLAAPLASLAQVPKTLSYQGVLADASGLAVADGDYGMTFRLYDIASEGTALWEETRVVTVHKGIFNVVLGSLVEINLPFNEQYWLGISVAGEQELEPRITLTSSAYSFAARGLIGSSNVVPSSGNAGIGTLSPDERLDVAGAVKLGTTGATHAGTIRWTGSDFEGYNGSSWLSLTETGEGLPSGILGQTLRNNGTSWMATSNLYNNGTNIGIGTTNPTERLEVNGAIKAQAHVQGSAFDAGSVSGTGQVNVYGNGIVAGLLTSNIAGGYLILRDEANNDIITLNIGELGGVLRVRRNETQNGLDVTGNYNNTQSTRVMIRGNSNCTFSMDETGNGSVVLPVDAIASTEMQNEPGATSSSRGGTNVHIATDYTAIGFNSITIPAAGYVLVTATATYQISHENGTGTGYAFGISADPDTVLPDYRHVLEFPPGASSGFHTSPFTFQRLFHETSSGTYTYYLLARKIVGDTGWGRLAHVTCVYLPTAYGAVATTSEEVSIMGSSRDAGQGMSLADVSAQRAASEAANMARIEQELDEMQARIRALENEGKK